MNELFVRSKFALSLFLCLAVLSACVSPIFAQTSSTGALTGTVTDPSGAVISGATVTATNVGTGQSRSTTTDSSGSYKFGLLPPGNYSLKFSASGFKTADVPSVTVSVAETPVLNKALEVGAQSEQITVESTAETIQTQNATNGGVVGSQEVTELPLVSRNYTQIVNLSPGVVSNVTTASSVGNGTVDVAANGARQNQNNYSMDGASIVNYVSGTAGQTGSYPGIAIPNPDTIQEFKVQTSQYDASSGRNPGVNVEVVTKSGTNQFHGAAWEFNRNNFFNANDFFYKASEANLGQPNAPQTLKQNTFGGTFGGPIIKDKFFFFGSYQGIRQINGIGTSGFASGYESNTDLMPWNDYADFTSGACTDLRCTNNVPAYKAYLGSVFAGQTGFFLGTGVTVNPCTVGDATCNSTNITNTAVALLQEKGVVKGGYNQGFYFPSAPASCGTNPGGCTVAISDPTVANENQYMINTDYVISSKHTLSEKYFLSQDPQDQTFNCFILPGNCNPGAPVNADYISHVGELKLTSVLTSSLVNEARFSFHRDIENNQDPNKNVLACDLPNGATIIPLENNGQPCPPLNTSFSEFNEVPLLDITGASGTSAWSQGGNFSMISSNFINTYQFGDQASWNHGKHAIRAGFEGERILYNNTIPASARGELLMWGTPDFLTSSSGPAIDGTPATPNGGIILGFGLGGQLTHYNRINAFDGYVQDDIKVSRKLTVNVGLRWEYDGFPDDKSGEFANVWNTQLLKYNTGSAFLGNPTGTLIGFIVPSNFATKTFGLTAPNGASGVLVNGNKTLVPGTPWTNFAPRLGVAWQPFSDRFVVRAGYGWFYDRIYGNLLIDNQLNLPPYSYSGSGPFPQSLSNTLHDPFGASAAPPGGSPLVWNPRYIIATGPGAYISSGLGYTSDSPQMANRLPLTQQYNLDLQYEFAHGWVVDVGYVGSHGIHLYNWSADVNLGQLVAGAPNGPTDPANGRLVSASLPFNDPANTNPVTANTVANVDERVAFLGFAPAGVATTSTNGDSLYNSLQLQLRHQFSHGLLVQASYTWSKAFTDVDTSQAGSGINPPGETLYGSSNSNNPLDFAQQYGPASFNRPQRLVVSYSYDLPWKHQEGLSGKVLGGWTITGVTTAQDGLPFTVTNSLGGTIYFGTAGDMGTRAELADPVDCNSQGVCQSGIPVATSGSTTSRAINGWINDAAFGTGTATRTSNNFVPTALPCIGGTVAGAANCAASGGGTGFGNSGQAIIAGPGQFNWDMALIKNTKITEGTSLQFRTEFFNIWNHPQFDPPFGNNVSTTSSAAPFGIITSTSTTPRVIQFALKFSF